MNTGSRGRDVAFHGVQQRSAVFLGAALMVAAAGSSTAIAQWQDPLPQFWCWSDEPYGWTHDDSYSSLVRVDVRGLSGTAAACAVHGEIVARATATPSRLSTDHVAILLQNFTQIADNESDTLTADIASLLFTDEDIVPDAPSGTAPDVFELGTGLGPDLIRAKRHAANLRRQPWMTQGAINLAEWTGDFVEQFASLTSPSITPVRFHFDVEEQLTGIDERNWAVLLYQIALDDRYSDSAYPIPGFGSQTLEDLFIAEQDAWSASPSGPWWPTGTTGTRPTLADSIVESTNPFGAAKNRQIWLWYTSVCQRALDAVLTDNVYSIIKSEWEECKISNYGDTQFVSNGEGVSPIEVDWTFVRSAYNEDDEDRTSTRLLQPGWLGQNEAGSMLSPEPNGTWFSIQTNTRGGDFDAPPYYTVKASHRVPDLNLPHDDVCSTAGSCDAPLESPTHADVRWIRHWAESILAHPSALSDPAAAATNIVPWTAMPGAEPWPTGDTRPINNDDLLAKFSLYRALGINEVPLWTDRVSTAYLDGLQQTLIVSQQVWAPTLSQWTVNYGSLVSPADDDTMRLRRVTRDDEGLRVTVDMLAEDLLEISHVTDLVIEFGNMDATGGDYLNVIIEGQAVEDDQSPISYGDAPSCLLMLYNNTAEEWVAFEGADDYAILGVHDMFGIYTPDASVRRSFRIDDTYDGFNLSDYLDSSHNIYVRLVSFRESVDYIMKWDLVQLSRFGIAPVEPEARAARQLVAQASGNLIQPMGADANFDGVVSSSDVLVFLTQYSQGKLAADVNNDGSVDETDVARFSELYSER